MKTKILLFTMLALFSMSGCDSFLEEKPRDIIAPENYFSSESDAKAALTGIYAILKNNSLYGQVGLDGWYDNGADILEPNRSALFLSYWCDYTFNETTVQEIAQLMGGMQTWKDLYRVVHNANVILENMDKISGIAESKRNELKGEALFLRSLAYYHLTNMWGNVPYFRKSVTLEEISKTGREDATSIRDEILVDLQQAQDWMPKVIVASERGRAPSWAAAMVIAKINLIRKNWQKARDKSLEIITNGGFTILPNYANVFNPNNEYNAELIWCLDFAKDIKSMLEAGVPTSPGNGWWRPSMFDPRIADEPKNSADKAALVSKLAASGEAFNGTGLQICIPDFVKKFPLNDLRKPVNIIEYYQGIQLKYQYMPKNWNLNATNSPRFNHSDNRIIFRLADAYLMAAEAENELNGPANAYQYINKVRERAYATQAEWELKGLTKDQFRLKIYDERKWELAGECHRRMDLIRWGILLDVVKTTEYRVYSPAAHIQPHMVLLPIGKTELDLNPALLESDPTNNGYR